MPQHNDLVFQPCLVLNGEIAAWKNRIRNAIIALQPYLIFSLMPARMEYSVWTGVGNGFSDALKN